MTSTWHPERTYKPVLMEITTALFACPDCGAIVWYTERPKHDRFHEQVEGLIATSWVHNNLLEGILDREEASNE